MYPRDWERFFKEGGGNEIAVAQVPAVVQAFLETPSDKVYLHHSYALKAAEKHHITAEWFALIFDTIEFGIAVNDRAFHVSFFYFAPESQRWYQVTVKKAQDTGRIYLCTFHRVQKRKVDNRRRTAHVIKQ